MHKTLVTLTVVAAALLSACGPTPTAPAPSTAAGAPAATPLSEGGWPFLNGEPAPAGVAFAPATLMAANYYVVFDASGSMKDSQCSGNEAKIAVAKRAFAEFVDRLPADSNVGLSIFAGDIREFVPLGPIKRDMLKASVARIEAGGRTPLVESMSRAYQALTAQGMRQLGYGEYNLIVVTDGESTDGNPIDVVNRMFGQSPVVLHTIGFCIGNTHSLNQPGRVLYRNADSPAALADSFAAVLAEAPSFDVTAFK